jgi:hypothetical protein
MKPRLSFFIILTVIFYSGCIKEVVKLNPFQQSILESSVYSGLPQLQSPKESLILKHNRVMSMSFVTEYLDSNKIDSLTYLRFNKDGKLIQRTTDEVTTVGCLPQTIIQIFRYENNKIKRIENYIFKYKVTSVFEKWMETDTSRLKMFDWEDYNYNGDTIFVESGYAKWKFIKDKKDNLVGSFFTIKSNKQIADVNYVSTPFGVMMQLKNDKNDLSSKDYVEYEVEANNVKVKSFLSDTITENIYGAKGLLLEKVHYKNDHIIARTKINYTYYL